MATGMTAEVALLTNRVEHFRACVAACASNGVINHELLHLLKQLDVETQGVAEHLQQSLPLSVQPAHAVRSVHPKTVTPRPNAWVAARAAVRAGHVEQAAELLSHIPCSVSTLDASDAALLECVSFLAQHVSAASAALKDGCQPTGLSACDQALSLASSKAPFPQLLARLHCMKGEIWLMESGNEHAASQAAQKALQYQPHMVRALWLHSQCLRDPLSRLCELQKLQAVDRSWPGLNAALATAASECLAEASSGDEDEGCGSPCAFYPAGPGRRTTQTASIPMTRRCMDNAGKLRHELDQAYALLGLQPGVHLSKDDVGRAYRRAAAQVHPDAARVRAGVDAAGNGNGNSEQFIALRQAFELLSSTV